MGSPNHSALSVLGALSILVAPGCAELFQPPPLTDTAPPPPGSEETSPSPAKAYGCANIRFPSKSRPAPVTLEALQKAVSSPDEATTAALLSQLGQARVREDASQPRVFQYEYSELGLQIDVVRTGDKQIIKSVELLSGSLSPTWPGPLPDGLSFAMSTRDTFNALGLPDEKRLRDYAGLPHHYRSRGLRVRFDTDGCILSVGLVARIAPRKIRFDNIAYVATKTERDLTGIHIGVTRALGDFSDPSTPMHIVVDLYDEKGEPVQALDDGGNAAGPLRVEHADYAADEIRRVVFVPFAAMRLSPGSRTLRAEFSARARDAQGAAVPIETEAGGSLSLSFEMPTLRRARVGVLRAEVQRGVYDSGAADAHFAAPDLRWVFAREFRGVFSSFTSATREDTFSASWSELTPWIVVATNDLITLCVEDEDVLNDETIGCVSLTLDEAISTAKQKKPLGARGVTRLLLAAPQVSPVAKR